MTTKNHQSKRLWKIYMVEDRSAFWQGMAQVLKGQSGLSVCGSARGLSEVLAGIARMNPDLVLLDVNFPGKNGLELIRILRRVHRTLKFMVLSGRDDASFANRVLRAGADGYVMKGEDPDEIVQAIRDVLAGKIYVSEDVLAGNTERSRERRSESKARTPDLLTGSELEILELLGQGKSNSQIARRLKLGVSSISDSRLQIRKKLNLKSAGELVRYAVCKVETKAA